MPLHIDAKTAQVWLDGELINVSSEEFGLLLELTQAGGRILSREHLLERVWGYKFFCDTRTVDMHIRQLRRKLGGACPITTVWGRGYCIAPDAL